MDDYKKAVEIWRRMEATKYPNPEIKQTIEYAFENPAFAGANAQCALAMIAYNEMIDSQIEKARKSWKRTECGE